MVLWPCHCNRCDWLPRNNYFDWLLCHYEGNRLIRWQHLWYTLRVSTFTPGLPCRTTMPGAFLWLFFDSTRHWSYPERYDCLGCDDCCSTAWLCIASGWRRQMLVIAWCIVLSALIFVTNMDAVDEWLGWTWDEWSECNDVYIDWAPVPSCSVTLSDWLLHREERPCRTTYEGISH